MELQQSLSEIPGTSNIGVAICDRRMRVQFVNDALALMNRLPVRAHVGKTLPQILGDVAARAEPAFQHVLATGSPLSNVELVANLHGKWGTGRWIQHYYPVKNQSGRVLQVIAIIVEVTKRNTIEQSLRRLADQLCLAAEAIRIDGGVSIRSSHRSNEQTEQPSRPLELLENCISEIRIISASLGQPLLLAGMRHPRSIAHPEREQTISPQEPLSSHDTPARNCDSRVDRLSRQERRVLRLLAVGKSNKEAAAILNISVRTIETYRARLMLKLDQSSIAQLVRYALRNNVI